MPPMLVMWLLTGIFENAFFGLFELVFNIAVVFLCLGPRDLDKEVDAYLDAVEVGDTTQRSTLTGQLSGQAPAPELPEQTAQVCHSVLIEANSRIYAPLFWFALFGPLAIVLYRLLEQLRSPTLLPESLHALQTLGRVLLGWIDWLPARLTLFAYMVSGGFDEGLQALRRGAVSAVDLYEQNHELLMNVGYHAIGAPREIADGQQAMQAVRKARGLVLRALVAWLVLILLYSLLD